MLGVRDISGTEKLSITAYKNPDYSGKVGEIEVMLNPTRFSHTLSSEFAGDDRRPIGLPDVSKSFKTTNPETISFELLFDGTGVVDGNGGLDVADQINSFYELCYSYNGDIHQPNFLVVIWGNITFKGRLTSCDLSYSLFKSNGTPIRAKADVKMEQFIDVVTLKKRLNINSPDMTHLRIVKEGDTLPLMCDDIYGDSSYYIRVAEVNGLNSFRRLMPGSKIFFPPIKK